MIEDKDIPQAYHEGLNKLMKIFAESMKGIQEEKGGVNDFFVIGFLTTFVIEGVRRSCKVLNLGDDAKLKMLSVIQNMIEKEKGRFNALH